MKPNQAAREEPIGCERVSHRALRWPDDLDLSALRYLAAAAETGKFGQAAMIMGVRTSTVSRNVAKTEDALGVTLFERGHFGIRLTAAGKAVMVQVRRALADLDAICHAGWSRGTGQVGEIHLAVRMSPIGSLAQRLLRSWRNEHPQIELTIHQMNERDIMLALTERRVDAALVPMSSLWSRVSVERIASERLLVALPDGHRLASTDAVAWDDLREETLLLQGWDGSQAEHELCGSLVGGGMRFKNHPAGKETILALVGADFGVALVSASQAEVRCPNVIYRPIKEANAQIELALAWVPQNEESVVGRFVAFVRDKARSRRIL